LHTFDRYLTRVETDVDPAYARPALVTSPGDTAFAPPEADPVDLSRRDAPRRIFARLARQRRRFPGTALPVDHLADVGWPGADLDDETAKSRVYAAISTLRELGLRNVLLTVDEGYLLSPAVRLVARD
jgi:hypothetical protein